MNLQPLSDKVLLQLEKAQENKTAGGIILTNTAQEDAQLAKVIAVGPGKKIETGEIVKPEVNAGDTVLISDKWNTVNVMLEGVQYKIVSSSDILAVLKN